MYFIHDREAVLIWTKQEKEPCPLLLKSNKY